MSVISKQKLYRVLFVICIAVPYFNNYELTFLVWSLCLAISFAGKYSLAILKHAACFVGILAIATLVTFSRDHEIYYILRDLTYVAKPIIGLLLGYQLCRSLGEKALKVVVYTGFVIAIYHIGMLVWGVLYFGAASVNDIRLRAGYFSDFEVYVLILLIFKDRFSIEISRRHYWLLLTIIGFSTFAYLARTNFIQFAILFIGMKGYYRLNRTSIVVITSFIMLTAIGYSAIVYMNPKREGDGLEAFLYKIKIAPEEAFKTRIHRDDWKDFNDNYRSYENIMTVRQMTAEGWPTVIFGKGLGSKVDLKQKVWLGDIQQRFISILHNGFMTVFLKSGLLGIVLLIISIRQLFYTRKTYDPVVRNINLLMIGTGWFMIFSLWVFMGYYFLADTKSVLIGLIIGYREFRLKSPERKTVADD